MLLPPDFLSPVEREQKFPVASKSFSCQRFDVRLAFGLTTTEQGRSVTSVEFSCGCANPVHVHSVFRRRFVATARCRDGPESAPHDPHQSHRTATFPRKPTAEPWALAGSHIG